MRRFRGFLFGGVMVLLAGCVTSQMTERHSNAPPDVPKMLQACGGGAIVDSDLFGMCGLSPNGAAGVAMRRLIYTNSCGWIEANEELKRYFCQNADGVFSARNPEKSTAFVAQNYHNKTRFIYSPQFGNQIQYMTADGTVYLWVANQPKVVSGEWILYRNAQICIHIIGVTERAGQKWDCYPLRNEALAEIVEGDVAKLSQGGAVPWVLQAQPRVTFAEVTQRLKSIPPSLRKAPDPKTPDDGAPAAPVPAEPLGPMVLNEYVTMMEY